MSRIRAYRFDRFIVDLDRMALIADGAEVPLRPKAFDTLRTLALHAGQVVTKDALVAAVWPDVFVNDDALAQCVRDVRKALGDEAQQMLRTVPRRGYMLAADVEPVSDDAGAERPANRLGAAVIALALLAIMGAAYWFSVADETRVPTREPRLTLAVLPFDAGGETDETAWLGEGLAEDIVVSIARFRDIAVIARNSSFRYRDAGHESIRDELGADFLVRGSVRRVDDRLRISVGLVDLSGGVSRWAQRYERDYADLPRMRDEIADEIAVALATQAREAVAGRAPSASVAAYELALKARKALLAFDREQAFLAMDYALRAVEADPDYAVAWDLLAQIRFQFFVQPYDERRGDLALLQEAREAAARAVSLDPAFSSGLATLAGLLSRDNDYNGALELLRRAVDLNPNDATVRGTYADILARAGEHESSLAAWFALERIDPVGTPLALALKARAQIFTDDLAGGLATARQCAVRAPTFQPCLVFLALAAAANGEENLARDAGTRLLAVNPAFTLDHHFRLIPFRRSEDVEFMSGHLRAAGLP